MSDPAYAAQLDAAFGVSASERSAIVDSLTLPSRLRDAMMLETDRKALIVLGVFGVITLAFAGLYVWLRMRERLTLALTVPVVAIVGICLLLMSLSVYRAWVSRKALARGVVVTQEGPLRRTMIHRKGGASYSVAVGAGESFYVSEGVYGVVVPDREHRLYLVDGAIDVLLITPR